MNIYSVLDNIVENENKEEEFHANKTIMRRVMRRIMKGNSDLKKAIKDGDITIPDMIKAITYNRCLRGPKRDFGNTYLEQIVGTAIRQSIPVTHINKARLLFGMNKLPPSELRAVKHQHQPQQIQQKQSNHQ